MSTITAYCLCALCCGSDSSRTASGTRPIVGVTIAAPRSIPFGTMVEVRVPGFPTMRRRVEDRTSRRYEGRWDVLMRTHREAREFGKRKGKVTIR